MSPTTDFRWREKFMSISKEAILQAAATLAAGRIAAHAASTAMDKAAARAGAKAIPGIVHDSVYDVLVAINLIENDTNEEFQKAWRDAP
jgi:hypothetical protein